MAAPTTVATPLSDPVALSQLPVGSDVQLLLPLVPLKHSHALASPLASQASMDPAPSLVSPTGPIPTILTTSASFAAQQLHQQQHPPPDPLDALLPSPTHASSAGGHVPQAPAPHPLSPSTPAAQQQQQHQHQHQLPLFERAVAEAAALLTTAAPSTGHSAPPPGEEHDDPAAAPTSAADPHAGGAAGAPPQNVLALSGPCWVRMHRLGHPTSPLLQHSASMQPHQQPHHHLGVQASGASVGGGGGGGGGGGMGSDWVAVAVVVQLVARAPGCLALEIVSLGAEPSHLVHNATRFPLAFHEVAPRCATCP